MQLLATIPASGKEVYYSPDELRLQLALSGYRNMTIVGPDSLWFATMINGQLQGWAMLQDTVLSHPIPFLYLYDTWTGAQRRWITSVQDYGGGPLPIKVALMGMSNIVTGMDRLVRGSIAGCAFHVGYSTIGGLKYPTEHYGTPLAPWDDMILEYKDIAIGSRNKANLGVSIALPMRGGMLSSDAIKFTQEPGPGIIFWHTSRSFFPMAINPQTAVPATYSPAAFEVGYIDNNPSPGTFHLQETINAVYRFHQLGSMTPFEIHQALMDLRRMNWVIDRELYDYPGFIDGGGLSANGTRKRAVSGFAFNQ
jgi:hypothetical protein